MSDDSAVSEKINGVSDHSDIPQSQPEAAVYETSQLSNEDCPSSERQEQANVLETKKPTTSMDSLIGFDHEKAAGCGQGIGQTTLRCCTVFSLVFAIAAAVMAFIFPVLYNKILNKELSLLPGTKQYDMWLNPPVPMYLRFSFFNVTNAQDVLNHGAKPILHELGPYTFEEKHIRVKIQSHDNFTLTFQQRRIWHFVADMSNGSLEDNITAINIPLVGAVHAMRYQSRFMKDAFNGILKMLKSEVFIVKTAGELLFDGYSDPLIDLGRRFPMGDIPPIDKFGWFYQRNSSDYYDGVFNIFTGVDDIKKFGELDMWNYTKQTKYYESYCGMINGSFGEGWAPRRNRSNISMYITDICRSITLDYTGEVKNQGVLSYRFAATERVFANSTDNPDNWCFCSDGICNPSGVGNSSSCRFGAPVFVSFPHYYLADPYYGNFVVGLNPQQNLHEFHIDLEPEMAAPTSVRARMQINVLIEPDTQIDVFHHFNRTYLPAIWFEIGADVTSDLGREINIALSIPIIAISSFFALFCLSMAIVISSCVVLIRRRRGALTVWRQVESTDTSSSIGPL